MAKQNPFIFADKVSSDSKLRSQLLEQYCSMFIDSMTPEEQIERLKRILIDEEIDEINEYGADDLISRIAINFPDILTKGYEVDISLLNHVG
jgi:hypothetical protein